MKTVKTAYGPCTFYGKDEYIGRSLYNYGEWSGEECSKIVSLAAGREGICVDVGANIGFMTMALLMAGEVVHAYEPQPAIYELLDKNTIGYDGTCFIRNIGLGDKKYTAKMPRIRYGAKGNYGGAGIGFKSELGTIDVEVETLDSQELENVKFIKIDVEGFEAEVLRGGRETILRDKPVMYIEDDRDDKRAALYAELKSLGYEWEDHNPPLYRADNFAGLQKNIWDKEYVSHNIICRARS
ncbi:MAG: hypothetical protein BWY21_00539 [Parcubacteria group bacterium ADurb.Bin216]|nr:MAG: hypothetical protein BWY21_00539 [Parcubacteria group bacterium ADurb.Bin216]